MESGPIRCAACHDALLADVTREGVVTLDGGTVPFRRHTDYVVCSSCLSSYAMVDVRQWRDQLVSASTRSNTAS